MWTQDPIAATRAESAMRHHKMQLKVVCGEYLDKSDLDKYSVVVVDRLPAQKILSILSSPVNSIFVIVKDWSELEFYEQQNDFRVCKFYLWPINWNLLIDDIRAISIVKHYIATGVVEANGLSIDINLHTLSDGQKSVSLRKREYELLVCLMKNKGRVLSRDALLEMVWDINSQINTNTVDVHISRLRRIMRFNFGTDSVIKTVPCVGYLFA